MLVVAVAVILIMVPVARAATPFTDVMSSGPLTNIYIGNELSCQVAHTGDSGLEFFPTAVRPGDCGTFLVTGGQLYAPDFRSHGGTATGSLGSYTPFTPVSQSAVTGSGTSSSPYQVTTTVSLGNTPLTITEVDSYVVGAENYRTDVTVSNSGSSAVSARLYRAGDCFLQNSDFGYGFVDPSTHAPACTETPNNSPPGRIEEFVPITAGIHYVETFFNTLWSEIGAHTDLPDTCDCTTFEDNSAGINWNITVPAGGSVRLSSLTVFSPLGSLALTTAKAADSGTAAAGSPDGYTITISNPNPTPVTLSDITDSLPAGFTYTAGSSSGATTTDPSIAGQNLTWTGPVIVPGSGAVTLHFKVTVASTPNTYFNNAGGDSANFTVTPTGPTAPVTVTSLSDQSISASGHPVSATEGQSVNGTVAAFSDPDTSAVAGEYSASIDWGDGSPVTSGTITGSGGSFTVNGSHTYADEGSHTVKVTITDVDNTSNSATVTDTATVNDAALHATGAAPATSPQSFSGPVATFTDDNSTTSSTADFTATIDWGDGGPTSTGTVTGTGGSYTVSGSHTYSGTGYFTITVHVADDGGSTADASSRVLVFGTSTGGNFVIGDENSSVGLAVTFWGAKWWKLNALSGGAAPSSFKGFESDPATAACGQSWEAHPGNSTPPPPGPLPAFMEVIVSSSISKSGSTISGDSPHLVVVQTNPGYEPDPGHPGTGTVIAQIC